VSDLVESIEMDEFYRQCLSVTFQCVYHLRLGAGHDGGTQVGEVKRRTRRKFLDRLVDLRMEMYGLTLRRPRRMRREYHNVTYEALVRVFNELPMSRLYHSHSAAVQTCFFVTRPVVELAFA
jgi:hypothetical protein